MKFLALFFAMFLALGMTACSDNNDADQASSDATSAVKDAAGEAKKAYDPEADEDGDC